MKSRIIKKLSAIALAAVLMIGMGVSVFAANLDGGKTGTPGTAITDGVTITKDIVFTNATATDVYEPDVTFTYTVTAGTVTNATITDSNSITAKVKPGVAAAISNPTATVTFANTNTQVGATAAGTTDSKTFTIGFDASKFSEPGVYRYVITETSSPASVADKGITRGAEYKTVRYLDVYVERNAQDAFEVYGYVLFESESADQSMTPDTVKSQGWVKKVDDSSNADVDVYETYNYTITKTITGSMADMDAKFPFTATVTNSITGAYYTLDDTKTAVAAAAIAKNLGNGDSIAIKGIPSSTTANVSVAVSEQNPTSDTYKASAKIDSTEVLASTNVARGATQAIDSARALK